MRRIYDITRELTTSPLYPGTPPVRVRRVCAIAKGDAYNLGSLDASLHAGTHCDAPLHFIDGAEDIASMPLSHHIGRCYVLEAPEGELTPEFFAQALPHGVRRLLLKGEGGAYLSEEGALHLAECGVQTVGTDALSVASPECEEEVHLALMRNRVAIIETLELSAVEQGWYMLFAPPVKIAGAEGAFCRAVLWEE